jgi:hypothetical protein
LQQSPAPGAVAASFGLQLLSRSMAFASGKTCGIVSAGGREPASLEYRLQQQQQRKR